MLTTPDFLHHTERSEHFFSKFMKTGVKAFSYVYLISPSRTFKPIDGCYESYIRQASFRNTNCSCFSPTCPSQGMNGAYPVGYEVATYIDDKERYWTMPSRVIILTMKDREQVFEFFKVAFSGDIQQVIHAACQTAFYYIMSLQLKSELISTRSLMHLDLIIFTLLYVLSNDLMKNDVFRAYCISEDPWTILSEFDPIWNYNRGCWMGKFMAYDALNSNSKEMRSKFSRIKLPLLKSISVPYVAHPLAMTVENNLVFYKEELIGPLVLYGDKFWLAKPTTEFLAGKAIMYSESRQLVIVTEEHLHRDFNWSKYLEELKYGKWKTEPLHREWALELDKIVQQYL